MSMLRNTSRIRHIRHQFGILNDLKLDNLKKLGLLSGPKKNLTTSLKLAAMKVMLLEFFTNLKNSFSPTVKFFQAFLYGLPRKPLYLLSHLLQKLLFLETFILQLKIYSPQDFPKKGLAVIGRSLRKLRGVKKFHMELEGRKEVPVDVLSSFARDLKHLQGLTELTLGMKSFRFNVKGISKVFKALNRLSKLRTLNLNMSNTYCQGDKGLKELAESLGKLQKLRAIVINFEGSALIEERYHIQLIEKLSTLNRLDFLDLSLSGCGVTSRVLSVAAKKFSQFKVLKTFKLSMYSNDLISAGAYSEFWEVLKELKQLEVLEIRVGTMTNLHALENKGLKKLGESVGELKGLKRLSLTLRGSVEFDDRGTAALGRDILKAENLEDIEIHFMQCSHITDDGLNSLREMLGGMLKVSKLTVRF